METQVKLTKLAKCAGCGAKVGAGTLVHMLEGFKTHTDPRLIVGYDKSDDASVYVIDRDTALVQTTDFFPPIVDDPYLYGQIAAANALSDVYAMGGVPRLAMNLLCVPNCLSLQTVRKILEGGHDKAVEAGCVIAGGHTIQDNEPKYGLCVTGFVHPDRILKNVGARPGDVLVLTKPLGSGVLTTAIKGGLCTDAQKAEVYMHMATLNARAGEAVAAADNVHACTDVTGFGLLGHSFEMAQGSDVTITLHVDGIDLIPAALEFARMGVLPAGMYRNRTFAEPGVDAGDTETAVQDLLYDPQTSGGLLMAVAPEDADALLAELKDVVPSAQRIGEVGEYRGGKRILLR